MKKISIIFGVLVLVSSLFVWPLKTLAADAVVDKEYLPGFNVYGRYNSVFISSCTRFVPGKSSYTNYFDLAVKNDQGGVYPMKASIRSAADPLIPAAGTLKTYTQSTFNNYAMAGNLLSRFSSNDGQGLTLTVGSYYFVCIDDLANNNATGWFYTASVAGGFSRQGYPGDVQNTFDGSFGYRTYAYTTVAPSGSSTKSKTTKGSTPETIISNSIVAPSNLAAAYDADKKVVNLSWQASTTATIGGYNIYRTETTGNDYKKIGDTDKTNTVFTDSDVTIGKTYYYMVRAYQDNAESVNSNEASVTLAEKQPEINANQSTTATSWYKQPWFWGLLAIVLILIGLLIFLIIRRRKKQKANINKKPEANQAVKK